MRWMPRVLNRKPEGELHTGRRHPLVLRHAGPGMAHPLGGTQSRRPAHRPPEPEVAGP
jgi:hypothetical protein